VHLTAAHTVSAVSGQTTSLYTHAGGIKAITANAGLSVRAHTDAQQVWSEQDLTVQSTTDEVRIQASKSITLTAGQSQIVIEGGDITFSCPGSWTVKGASHDWLGGGSQPAALMLMPDGMTEVPSFIELQHTYRDQSPVKGAPYKLVFANGQVLEGKLDPQGRARIDNPPSFQAKVEFGEDDRAQPEAFIKPMENPILGAKPRTREEAQALFDQYAEQERVHLEDHFFDDEIALMQSEQSEHFDHDGYDDYAWPDEGQHANPAYRVDHPSPQGGNNATPTSEV